MGKDIYGWIEIKDRLDENWLGVTKIHSSVLNFDRNKEMETWIFSTHTDYQYAIAPQRGVPEDVSVEFSQLEAIQEGSLHSWVMWDELQIIDLQKMEKVNYTGNNTKYFTPNNDFRIDLTGGWKLIFDLMRTLSEHHGATNVRLVVGFL